MGKRLISLITLFAILGAAFFYTRPPAEANIPEKDDEYYRNVVTDMRAMTPEGENGDWSDQQTIWLTLACKDLAERQSSAEGVPDGHIEIIEICDSVQQQQSDA